MPGGRYSPWIFRWHFGRIADSSIGPFSREAREKVVAAEPVNLGQASRVPGVSRADVTGLMLWLELEWRRQKLAGSPGCNAAIKE